MLTLDIVEAGLQLVYAIFVLILCSKVEIEREIKNCREGGTRGRVSVFCSTTTSVVIFAAARKSRRRKNRDID